MSDDHLKPAHSQMIILILKQSSFWFWCNI